MRYAANLALFLTALFLGGCLPGAPLSTIFERTPAPTATQQILRIGVTPALHSWAQQRLSDYSSHLGSVAEPIRLVPISADHGYQAVKESEVAMLITSIRPEEDFFATLLGFEGIVIATHPENPVQSYSSSDLQKLFSGMISDWDVLGWEGSIIPVIPLPGDDLRVAFRNHILENQPYSSAALIGPTPFAIANLIQNHPTSIGFLAYSDVAESMRFARVDSILPSNASISSQRYPLGIQVFGITITEPRGVLRDWVTWLQGSL